ncbi:MAG TPA: NADP-specific glutamate dehydrogenase [Gemmatimonadaceae bacterium]|nr:NADP-specific glutamate dehydrogenase [Gemmatimonadaceae bacterium]
MTTTAPPAGSAYTPGPVAADVERFMEDVIARNPHELEFHQAVREVAESVMPLIRDDRRYRDERILDRMAEPDRVVSFRVTWEDDEGHIQINRAWRVQFNGAIGPYKGGLRFHPSVTLSVLKFLGFEQTFKNSLTGLPMGGGKGGSTFDPKGRSDREVMRFCQALMTELHRHIGERTDVPAGDIGVGGREIGYMFGAYRKLENRFTGVFTGKAPAYGGSYIRPEATGYGLVYFTEAMLASRGEGIAGKTATVSGSGNVALHAIDKLNQLGAKVVTASDSGGFIHDPNGISPEKSAWLHDLKEVRRGRIAEYADRFPGASFHAGQRPWRVPCDLAFPNATQNELDLDDARALVANRVQAVAEGANMPTTPAAVHHLLAHHVLFGPAKAANAGGVAVSGLEQTQNSMRMTWTSKEVDERLKHIMLGIHETCVRHGSNGSGFVNYVHGANIGGFVKVADAMLAYGVA